MNVPHSPQIIQKCRPSCHRQPASVRDILAEPCRFEGRAPRVGLALKLHWRAGTFRVLSSKPRQPGAIDQGARMAAETPIKPPTTLGLTGLTSNAMALIAPG